MTTSNHQPANQDLDYEKEIRDIYRERNSRHFNTPADEKAARRSLGWGGLAVMLIISLLAGFAGAVVVMLTLQSKLTLPVIYTTSRMVTTSTSDWNQDNLTKFGQATVAIFTQRTPGKAATLLDQAYLSQEALGQGLVLSSDGWIVTAQTVVGDGQKPLVVAAADGYVHNVTAIILDPVAPLAYLKIKADNLAATAFVRTGDLAPGQMVLAAGRIVQSTQPSFYTRRLSSLSSRGISSRPDLVVSSESLPDRYLLDQSVPFGQVGMPVANTRGEVLGLLSSWNNQLISVIPLDSVGTVIDGLFANQQVSRPTLGVSYVQSFWLKPYLTQDVVLGEGALLLATGKNPAVNSKGPAASLKENDLIVALDGQRFNGRSLSAMLQQYRPGAKVEFTISRGGQVSKLTITLGEQVAKNVVK